jgi:hypothetical protein
MRLKVQMGAEAACTVRINGRSSKGKARLETDVLQFRGADLRLDIPFKSMKKVSAREGTLSVTFPDGVAVFALGDSAATWADKIQHPPSRLDKIGVKPGWRACAIAIDDETFLDELKSRVAELVVGRTVAACDAVFYGATREADLNRLEKLKAALKPAGALWIVRPKGRPEISEMAVMRAGKSVGLVDVKVVSFSPTHTAEKFVIPVAARR